MHVFERVVSQGPGHTRESAFCVEIDGCDADVLRLILKCHINSMHEGAEGETWRIYGDPEAELYGSNLLVRLLIYSEVHDNVRTVWYQIPTSPFLTLDTLYNILKKTFKDIV